MLLSEVLRVNRPKIFPLGFLREKSLSLEGFFRRGGDVWV